MLEHLEDSQRENKRRKGEKWKTSKRKKKNIWKNFN